MDVYAGMVPTVQVMVGIVQTIENQISVLSAELIMNWQVGTQRIKGIKLIAPLNI